MARVADLFGVPADERVFEKYEAWPLPSCLIGIELELEGFNDRQREAAGRLNSPYWSTHRDDSLREGGVEFVTQPLFGKDLLRAMEVFPQIIATLGANPRISNRCGLHIHIDVRDLNVGELITMLGLYTIFEKPLFKVAGDGRDKSVFCVPYYKAQHLQYELSRSILDDSSFRRTASIFNEGYRYAAVNFGALEKFGTLEFRHKKATLNFEEIKNWICLIMNLKRWSIGRTYDQLPEFVSEFGMRAFVGEVFLDWTPLITGAYDDQESLARDVLFGVRELQAWLRLHSIGLEWQNGIAASEFKTKLLKIKTPKKLKKGAIPTFNPETLRFNEDGRIFGGIANAPNRLDDDNHIRQRNMAEIEGTAEWRNFINLGAVGPITESGDAILDGIARQLSNYNGVDPAMTVPFYVFPGIQPVSRSRLTQLTDLVRGYPGLVTKFTVTNEVVDVAGHKIMAPAGALQRNTSAAALEFMRGFTRTEPVQPDTDMEGA